MFRALIDTDTLSLLMRADPRVTLQGQAYLATWKQFSFSVITKYEVLRGLKSKGAVKQLDAFGEFCRRSEIVPLTDRTADVAAEIHSDLQRRGEPIGDADILIAATALSQSLSLVTNNERHFSRIKQLDVLNWLK